MCAVLKNTFAGLLFFYEEKGLVGLIQREIVAHGIGKHITIIGFIVNLLTSSMRHPNYYSLSVRSKSGFTARCFSVRKRVLVK